MMKLGKIRSQSRIKKEESVNSKKAMSNVSPEFFICGTMPTVPPSLTNIIDWLVMLKPTRMDYAGSHYIPNWFPLTVKQPITKLLNKVNYPIENLKQNFDDWTHAMDQEIFKKHFKSVSIPSIFKLRADPCPVVNDQNLFKVTMKETETLHIFYQSKKSAKAGTLIAEMIEKENYDYLNKDNKFTKITDMNSQTSLPITVNKSCDTKNVYKKDKGTMNFASDFYDTEKLAESVENKVISAGTINSDYAGDVEKEVSVYSRSSQTFGYKRSPESSEDEDSDEDELIEAKRITSVLESSEFFKVALTLRRILEMNNNEQIQAKVKKCALLDPLTRKLEMDYRITHLRMARFHKVWGMPVTSVSINPANNNLFATGHGQYFNHQPIYLGRINIWNLKNLSAPEKTMDFEHGVTSVSFSVKSPYALLVSFINGCLVIINISTISPTVIVKSKVDALNSPIWQSTWFNTHHGQEIVVCCGTDGIINWFDTVHFKKKQLMLFSRREGFIRGIKIPVKSCKKAIKMKQRPDVCCIAPHPTNPLLYLAGTEDGCIHMCSTDYSNEQLQSVQSHHGPVHRIRYHPDTPQIILSVGVDYCVRVWATQIYEPLITISTQEDYIEDADWSPQNPSIIVTISGCYLSLWDIRLISTEPRATISSPTKTKFSTVNFINSNTVLTGDVYGDVHIWGLSNLPYIPTYKAEAFSNSIKRLLTGNNELLEELRKLGYPFDRETI